jgi:hypothetical protein
MTYSGDIIPKGYKQGQLANFDPQQMQLYKQGFDQVGPQSYLSKLAAGDQSAFDETEAPAKRQFQGLLGQLGSRFSGLGMGSRHGSGFNLSANQATSDFAQDLASKRQQLRSQAINDLMGLSNNLLSQRPYDRFLTKKQQKQGTNWGGITGAGLGAVGGFFAGGPMGAFSGASTGYNIGSGFSGYDSGGSSGGFQSSPGWEPSWDGQGGGYNALPGLEDQFRTGQAY